MAGSVLFWSYLLSTIVTPLMGYVYDIVGRFWFMIPSCYILSLQLGIIPYSAPHFWLLCLFRSVMSCLCNVISVNPLIIDYVKSESRGLVMSFATLGLILGELTMVVMFSATRGMNMHGMYWVPAAAVAALSTVLIFLVREPKIKQQPITPRAGQTIEEANSDITFWERFRSLTKEAWHECKTKPKYIFCFICLMVSRLMSVLFSVYLQLWVMSFEKSGVLSSKEESDAIYMRVVSGALIAILIVAPIFGFMSDKSDPRVIVPASFLIRGLVSVSFGFINDPRDWHAYALCILMIVVSIIQFICVEVLFMRHMKSHIRGTLSGIAFFFGSIGTTTFALVGGIIFDKIGPAAPFLLVGSADMAVLMIAMAFIMLGAIKRSD